MIEKTGRWLKPFFKFSVLAGWVEMWDEPEVADDILFLGEDTLEEVIVESLGVDLKLSDGDKKITDVIEDCGIDEGFVDFEDFGLNVGDADDWEAVVDSFEVALEHEEFHAFDKGVNLSVEITDVVLSVVEHLRSHVIVDIPSFIVFEWFLICEAENLFDFVVKLDQGLFICELNMFERVD